MLLNCNSSLRVPPLLAYDLSNFDVVLLFSSLALPCLYLLSLTNLTTASLFLYNLGGITKLSGSHDYMPHS